MSARAHRRYPLTVTAVIIRILIVAGLVWMVFHASH